MNTLKPIIDYLTPICTYNIGKPLQKPTVYFRMTPLCNLRCIICDEWRYDVHSDRHDPKKQLSTEEYKKIIDSLSEFGVERLQFGGGEPLMRKDTTDLIFYAKNKGTTTRILTNGALLSDIQVAESLARGIDEVWLSIDSPEPQVHDKIRGVEGTFNKVMQGIDNLNQIRNRKGDRFFKICVATHFSPHNIFNPHDLSDLLFKKQIDFMLCTPTYDGYYGQTHFSTNIKTDEDRKKLIAMIDDVRRHLYESKVPVQTNPISLDIVKEYYKNPKIVTKFNCFIGGYELAFIETNGEVYPCTAYPVSMGNIKQMNFNFEKLWLGKQAKEVRRKIKKLQCGGCFHLQAQKNHLYSATTLIKHFWELPKVFQHLVKTHNISNPDQYKNNS